MRDLPAWPLAVLVLFWIFSARSPLKAQADPRWAVTPNVNALDDNNVTPNSPALAKSLTDAAEFVLRWKPPKTAAEWSGRSPEVERALRKAIGLETLPERSPLNTQVVATHDMGDYVLENVIFESRPGFPVTANLYRPKEPSQGKGAAVLCPIGHHLDRGKRATAIQIRCIKLAKMGFVVLTYDAIGHGESMIPGNIHHEAGYALLPVGETVAGWMVWDSMRAIDYLRTVDEVDPNRIGMTGNSGGGLNTLFTAALDRRVRAAAIAGYTFQFNNWIKYGGPHCTCTQLPGLYRAMEWFEIAGLIAPRPVLMLQGERDNIFRSAAPDGQGEARRRCTACSDTRDGLGSMSSPGNLMPIRDPFENECTGGWPTIFWEREVENRSPRAKFRLWPRKTRGCSATGQALS